MPTILLIEDAADLAQVIVRELESVGYRTLHAGDGRTGLEQYLAHPPDLLILDWMLPGMDGLEVLRRIRQHSLTVPILMLTARSDETDRVIGLEVGADDYLVKPFGMRELLARVRALLRRVEAVEQTVRSDKSAAVTALRYDGLLLDPASHRVTLDNVPIELTRIEFDLLQLFLRHPGRAFGRAYLLDTVWHTEAIIGDRTVDNALLRLRKKLGRVGEAIETVWGVGYRLREPHS